MVKYSNIHDELHKHTISLSKQLAEKRKSLDESKAKKGDYKQLAIIEKEINLNYNVLKSLMKLSLLQAQEQSL
jgi:hypothetical protein